VKESRILWLLVMLLMDSSFAMGSGQIAHGDFLDIDVGSNHFWLGFSLGDRMIGDCRCRGVG
jgi:hypothetical protein